MTQHTKTLLVWLGLIVACLALANYFGGTAASRISVTELDKLLEEGVVQGVEIDPDQKVLVTLKTESAGRYRDYGPHDRLFAQGPLPDDYVLSLIALSKERKDFEFDQKAPTSGFWSSFAANWLPLGVLLIVSLVMIRNASGRPVGSGMFGKSRAKMHTEHHDKVKFSEVAGATRAKEALQDVVDFLHDTRKYLQIGGRIPKGVLLVGPPGCGKTLLAKAVAGEAGVSFMHVSGADFVEMFVGVGAARVRDLFESAKNSAPCIVFIDELDAIGRTRGSGIGGGHDEREQTLNQLLTALDGFEPTLGVILIAATNRADILDRALVRPGRFDRHVEVPLPSKEERAQILEIHARSKVLEDDVNLPKVADLTARFSGADLENLVNEAAIQAVKRGADRISSLDFEGALANLDMGRHAFSLLDLTLIESTTQVSRPMDALDVRLITTSGRRIDGNLQWMSATHLKILNFVNGKEVVLPKNSVISFEPLADGDGASGNAEDWQSRVTPLRPTP